LEAVTQHIIEKIILPLSSKIVVIMAQLAEDDHADVVSQKLDIAHQEDIANITDHEMSPWQCIAQNPKIVLWTIFTNSSLSSTPCSHLWT
jgi:hypothetical protein